MTKQDDIRDGVILNIVKAFPDKLNRDVVELADKILKDEDSQGVVVKVERELPIEMYHRFEIFWYEPEVTDLLEDLFSGESDELSELTDKLFVHVHEAGFVAVEPLIEVKDVKN